MNISKAEFHKFAEVFRLTTGSTMKDGEILNGYKKYTSKNRLELFSKIDLIIKDRNIPFDKALPLITVDLNVLAAEEQTDPAILLMIYVASLNKYKNKKYNNTSTQSKKIHDT
ncbi:MAG: hypothetical protein JWM44_4324 [Bacilli bacterium]|nr:hypothetical protein [Bacilli bacterium]